MDPLKMLLEVSVKISGKELLKPQKPEALPEAHGIGDPGKLQG